MMMSMFSSFEAACAESYGRKVNFKTVMKPSSVESINNGKEGHLSNSNSNFSSQQQWAQQRRTPRYALLGLWLHRLCTPRYLLLLLHLAFISFMHIISISNQSLQVGFRVPYSRRQA